MHSCFNKDLKANRVSCQDVMIAVGFFSRLYLGLTIYPGELTHTTIMVMDLKRMHNGYLVVMCVCDLSVG